MLWDFFSLFPAYAGVIPIQQAVASSQDTFPRIRGGDPISPFYFVWVCELFPAYAGVIRHLAYSLGEYQTFPRIRGGDPALLTTVMSQQTFSPHTRG